MATATKSRLSRMVGTGRRLWIGALLATACVLSSGLPLPAVEAEEPEKRSLYVWVDFDRWHVPGLMGWKSGVDWQGNEFQFPAGKTYDMMGELGWSFRFTVPLEGKPTVSDIEPGPWLAQPPEVSFLDLEPRWKLGPGVRVDMVPKVHFVLDIPRGYGPWNLPAWQPRAGRERIRMPAGSYPLTGDRGWSLTLAVGEEGLAVSDVKGGPFNLTAQNVAIEAGLVRLPAPEVTRVHIDVPPVLGNWSIPGWTQALDGYQTVGLRPGKYSAKGALGWSFELEITGEETAAAKGSPGPILSEQPRLEVRGRTVRAEAPVEHRLHVSVPEDKRDWRISGDPGGPRPFQEADARLFFVPRGSYALDGHGQTFRLPAIEGEEPLTGGIGISGDGSRALSVFLPSEPLKPGGPTRVSCSVLGEELPGAEAVQAGAWLVPYPEGGEPREASWTGGLSDGVLGVPSVPPGLYRVRFAAALAGAPSFEDSDLHADVIAEVAPDGPWQRVHLSIARNRKYFNVGDPVEFTVLVQGGGAGEPRGPLTLWLVQDDRSSRLREVALPGNGPLTLSGVLNATHVAPGELKLRARLSDSEADEVAFHLLPAERTSNFKIHAYGNVFGNADMVEDLAELGVTVLNNQSNNPRLLRPQLSAQDALLAARLTPMEVHPALTSFLSATPYQAWLELLVKHGHELIAQYSSSHMFFHHNTCHLDPQVNRGVGRGIQLMAQMARHYQPYISVNLGDESCVHWATPEPRDLTCPYCAGVFQAQHGAPPPVTTEDEERWYEFCKFQQELRPHLMGTVREMIEPIRPDAAITAQSHAIGLFMWGGYPPVEFKNQDISVVHNYSDFQGSTLWVAYADALVAMAPKPMPFWPLLWSVWPYDVTKHELWMSAAFGIEGVGHFTMNSALEQPELKQDHELLKRFGDVLLNIERPTPPVAVLYSFYEYHRDFFPPVDWWDYVQRTAGQLYLVLRAGYDANLISEEAILGGGLSERKVLTINAVTRMRPEVKEGIEAFARQGGTVFVDDETTVDIEGAQKIGYGLDEFYAWTFGEKAKERRVFDDMEVLAGLIEPTRQKLAPLVETPFQKDNPRLIVTEHRNGDGSYLFLMNDNQVALDERDAPNKLGERNQPDYLPLETGITIGPASGAVYDLFTGDLVQGQETEEGLGIPVQLEAAMVQVLCVFPRRLGGIRTTAAAEDGWLAVRSEVVGSDGEPLRVAVPLEVAVTDPAGGLRWHLYRSTDEGRFAARFPLGGNDLAGRYVVSVSSPLGDTESRTEVAVGEVPSPDLQIHEDVVVYEEEAMPAFLAKAEEVTLAIGRPEHEPIAARLAGILESLGIQTETAYDTELLWKRFDKRVGYGLYRSELGVDLGIPDWQIDSPLIAIGTPFDNRLVAETVWFSESGPHLVSADWPGPGKGTVQLVRGGFSLYHDTLLLSGSDLQGVQRAARAFVQRAYFGRPRP